MKSLQITIIFSILAIATFGQQSVLKQHGIRTVTSKITNPNKPEKCFTLTQKLDKKGNLIEEIKVDIEGKIIEHNLMIYEKNKKTTFRLDPEGNKVSYETTIKNKEGKTVETISENYLKQRKETRKYIFDKWGKLVEEEWLNTQNQIERTKKYFYDSEGMLIKQISLDSSGQIIFQREISYVK